MTGFRPFFNAATGEWIEFIAMAEDSDRQLVRFSWRSVPGGVITEQRTWGLSQQPSVALT